MLLLLKLLLADAVLTALLLVLIVALLRTRPFLGIRP